MLCAFSDKLLSGCIDKLETYDHILDLGQMPYKWEVWVSYQIGVWYQNRFISGSSDCHVMLT